MPVGDIVNYKGNQGQQELTFEKLLKAFHRRPFEITSYNELELLTSLADYYLALPVLSTALYSSLCQSPNLVIEIRRMPNLFLQVAVKLRSEILLREALVFSCGPWHNPAYLTLEDPKLKLMAASAYHRIAATIMKVQELCNLAQRGSKLWRENQHTHVANGLRNILGENGTILTTLSWPKYIRSLSHASCYHSDYLVEMKAGCQLLLEDHRQFNPKRGLAGEGEFDDYFFCAQISDEELPWDRTKADW